MEGRQHVRPHRVTVTVTHTVPLASLFQDPDTPGFLLRFDVDATTGNLGTDKASGAGTWEGANDQNLLVLELDSGKLTYVSDKLRGHDGDSDDGEGNVLSLHIQANDKFGAPGGAGVGTAKVNLRLNVAPLDIQKLHPDAGANAAGDPMVNGNLISAFKDIQTGGSEVAVTTAGGFVDLIELNENQVAKGGEVLLKLNVLDENSTIHRFGMHEVTVNDDRFVITNSGNGVKDGDRDGSTWELRLKPGAKLRLRDRRRGRQSLQRLDGVRDHVHGHRRRWPEHANAPSERVSVLQARFRVVFFDLAVGSHHQRPGRRRGPPRGHRHARPEGTTRPMRTMWMTTTTAAATTPTPTEAIRRLRLRAHRSAASLRTLPTTWATASRICSKIFSLRSTTAWKSPSPTSNARCGRGGHPARLVFFREWGHCPHGALRYGRSRGAQSVTARTLISTSSPG